MTETTVGTNWHDLVTRLQGIEYQYGVLSPATPVHRIEFEPGLTDHEVVGVEGQFGFRFPPDLRAFLQTALPRGPQFPDWRSGRDTDLGAWLDRPRQGVLFDIEFNGFWLDEWGPRPRSLAKAKRIASDHVAAAPKLIPVYAHRMMPDEPQMPGNPVFSVHQTDIIHYGFDLADYLRHEFGLPGREPWPAEVRSIRFWDPDRFQQVRWNGGPCFFDNRGGRDPDDDSVNA